MCQRKQNAVSNDVSLRDRWRYLPQKQHRTIGNILFPAIILLCIGLFFCSIWMLDYNLNHAGDKRNPPLGFLSNLIPNAADKPIAMILATLLEWFIFPLAATFVLHRWFLTRLAVKFHNQSSKHELALYLIIDSANRQIYNSSYLKHQEYVKTIKATYQTRLDELDLKNASSDTVTEIRDELRTLLQEADKQLDDVCKRLLENEGTLVYFDWSQEQKKHQLENPFDDAKLMKWLMIGTLIITLCLYLLLTLL